jgi:hypothetical protein
MYNYKIGYTTMEENEFIELTHENQYSKEEIEEMVFKASIKTIKGNIKNNSNHIHSFSSLLSPVVQYFVAELGFKAVEFESEFKVFGWPSIYDNNDWQGQRGEVLERLTSEINAAGLDWKNDPMIIADAQFHKIHMDKYIKNIACLKDVFPRACNVGELSVYNTGAYKIHDALLKKIDRYEQRLEYYVEEVERYKDVL